MLATSEKVVIRVCLVAQFQLWLELTCGWVSLHNVSHMPCTLEIAQHTLVAIVMHHYMYLQGN
jgi:hypothetical protein